VLNADYFKSSLANEFHTISKLDHWIAAATTTAIMKCTDYSGC